jgi:hypothetical protein
VSVISSNGKVTRVGEDGEGTFTAAAGNCAGFDSCLEVATPHDFPCVKVHSFKAPRMRAHTYQSDLVLVGVLLCGADFSTVAPL